MKKYVMFTLLVASITTSFGQTNLIKDLVKFTVTKNNSNFEGLKNKGGNIIIAAKYTRISLYDDYILAADDISENPSVTYFDSTGKLVAKFDGMEPFKNGFATVYSFKDNKTSAGLINKSGKLIVQFGSFDKIEEVKNGYAVVLKNYKKGLIDTLGKIIAKPIYSSIVGPSDGMIRIMSSGRWGYLNTKGEIVIQPVYFYAEDFVNGYANVCLKTGVSFKCEEQVKIDKTGKVIN